MIDVASVASRDTLPLIVHFVLIMKTTARRTLGAARTTAAANTGAMTAQAIADALQTITGIPNNQSLQIHLAYQVIWQTHMSLYFSLLHESVFLEFRCFALDSVLFSHERQ
jgi:hypothetical protein